MDLTLRVCMSIALNFSLSPLTCGWSLAVVQHPHTPFVLCMSHGYALTSSTIGYGDALKSPLQYFTSYLVSMFVILSLYHASQSFNASLNWRIADPKEAWRGSDCVVQRWNHMSLVVAVAIEVAIAIAGDFMLPSPLTTRMMVIELLFYSLSIYILHTSVLLKEIGRY